jgi:hypothetical protein
VFRHWHRLLCVIFTASGAVACAADTELDRIYIASLRYDSQRAWDSRAFVAWANEWEKWKRGELGPNAAEPRWRPHVERMRFMEREFAAFLERTCGEGGANCILRQLAPFGFKCNDTVPIECWANTIEHADYYDYFFTRSAEYHAWIVTVSQEDVKPAVHVRGIILPRNPN